MDSRDIRKLKTGKIRDMIGKTEVELAELILQINSGEEKNYKKKKALRKDLAKLNTILREKEIIEKYTSAKTDN